MKREQFMREFRQLPRAEQHQISSRLAELLKVRVEAKAEQKRIDATFAEIMGDFNL